MSEAIADRRASRATHQREKRREASWLTQVEGPAGDSSLGRVANVSLGGLLVQTSTTFRPGTRVTIRFHMRRPPQDHFVESRGLVVHEESGSRMGVRFLQLQGSARLALREFVYGMD